MEVEISVCISINYSKIIAKYYAHDFCSLNYPSENLGTNCLAHMCTRLLYEKVKGFNLKSISEECAKNCNNSYSNDLIC